MQSTRTLKCHRFLQEFIFSNFFCDLSEVSSEKSKRVVFIVLKCTETINMAVCKACDLPIVIKLIAM